MDFEIPLPLRTEQRRIAAILDQADELRRKRRKAIGRLKVLSASIVREAIGNPVANTRQWPTEKLAKIATFENGDRSEIIRAEKKSEIEGFCF